MKTEDGHASTVSDDENASFLGGERHTSASLRWRTRWRRLSPYAWLLTTGLVLAGFTHNWYISGAHRTDIRCGQQLSAWSPAYEAVEYEDVQFESDFWQDSIYRGKPTPELEKAWDDLWHIGIINVPEDKLSALNKSSGISWRRTAPESGGGIAAGLEVFHEMHCLDMIRQYTWRDEYDYSEHPTFSDDPAFVRAHVDHCIEALRVRLMCAADVTPYLQRLEPDSEAGATPDFNTQHKCRNYGKIQDWARANKAKVAHGEEHVHGDGHQHEHEHQ